MKEDERMEKLQLKGKGWALLPIFIFLSLYLGLGITFEYLMKIPMGFYNVPVVVIFLVALMVAALQNRRLPLQKKWEIMAKGVGDANILNMVLIFLVAGIFVGVVGRSSAESVAYFFLSIVPSQFSMPILFLVSCFVSLSMGTSVGTISLMTPIGVALANASGYNVNLCVATIIGGAMFGDNLSFISDTTIAACNGQGCEMREKFRQNFKIALPAALGALVVITIISFESTTATPFVGEYHLVKILPYLLVLGGGLFGLNVFLLLLVGIFSGGIINYISSGEGLFQLVGRMGEGVSSMFETAMVALLVSAICSLIRHNGGFEFLLFKVKGIFKGKRGGQLGMGLLVGALDIATANNTVAIVMANPIAKQMADEYGISNKRAASILDTFSCIVQGVLPYGAQMLVALSAAREMGENLTAFALIPYLFYPFFLLIATLIFIALERR